MFVCLYTFIQAIRLLIHHLTISALHYNTIGSKASKKLVVLPLKELTLHDWGDAGVLFEANCEQILYRKTLTSLTSPRM